MITRSVFTSKLQSINNLERIPNPETAAVAAKATRLRSNLIYNKNNNNENKYNHGNRWKSLMCLGFLESIFCIPYIIYPDC